MSELIFKAVEKSYGSTAIIPSLDLTVASGELLVVLGPSGCGKSTLLRLLAGLESLSRGDILVDGVSMAALPPKDRNMAMVFQNYALYPHMTVFENMVYGLKVRGHSKAVQRQRVNKAAEMLQLSALLSRLPKDLSGGQRQRVAMGRAIVREPKVFLFDEPLSNLDAKLRLEMRQEIGLLQQQLGVTSLYVTHDQVEAMTLGHRIVLLNKGRIEQIGTPKELYERPKTRFVAGFLGSPAMNFLHIERRQGVFYGGDQALNFTFDTKHWPDTVTLGLRPEHLSVLSGKETGLLSVQLQSREYLGADVLLYTTLTGSSQPLVLRCLAAGMPAKDRLAISIQKAHIYAFDSTGQVLHSPKKGE